MSRRGHRLAVIAAIGLAAPAAARQDAQVWLAAQAAGPVAGPIQASVDIVQRHGDAADGRYQRVVTGMAGYTLSRNFSLWAGYVDSRNYREGRRTVLEHRLRQDVRTVLLRPGRGELSGRLRFEQRWRDGTDDTGWRARLLARYAHPLGATQVYVSHESFVNFDTTDWGQRAGWERMRNAVGLQLPLTKAVRADLGYLNQYLRQPGDDEDAHVATLGLSLRW